MEELKLIDTNQAPQEHSDQDVNKLTKEALIDVNDPPKRDPVLLKIKDTQNVAEGLKTTVLSLGNISVIKGKSKAKKSFASKIFAAACVEKNNFWDMFYLQEEGFVIMFDTEQGKYRTYKGAQTVNEMNGTGRFFAPFSLREYEPEMRMKIIENALYNCQTERKKTLVIIDGIRDLVYDINDQHEATQVTTRLMQITEELNVHIMTIIHENKGDGNSRGHIGTEIQNKCETVMQVEKAPDDESISVVKPVLTREKEFQAFRFCVINNCGILVPSLEVNRYEDREEVF